MAKQRRREAERLEPQILLKSVPTKEIDINKAFGLSSGSVHADDSQKTLGGQSGSGETLEGRVNNALGYEKAIPTRQLLVRVNIFE